jgi:thiol-disulfide isomerase/thioredoxin
MNVLRMVVLAIGMAGAASGQEPDGEGVMREMAGRVRDAGWLTFDVKFEGVGSQGLVISRGSGRGQLAAGEDGDPRWRYRLDGSLLEAKTGAKHEYAFAFDGDSMRWLDDAKKEVVEAESGEENEIVGYGAARPMRWLWRWDVFVSGPFGGEGESPYSAAWLGKTEIDDVACDIVRVDYSSRADVEELDLYWYIGEEDRMPRRVEATYFSDSGGLGVAHISGFQRATVIDLDAFTIEPPAGYELKERAAEVAQGGGRQQPVGGIKVGEAAPAWELLNSAGEKVSLESLRGKVVLMDFWATWCGPCKAAMPGVQLLHEELGDKGLAVIGVNCWDDPEAAVAYMKEKGYTYTTVLNGDDVAGQYRVSGIPTFYVIGPDGKVAHHVVGHQPGGHEALKEMIEGLLPQGG